MIGLSFFTFGLPPLLLSAFMGRFIDREGGFLALVVGIAGIGISGLLYPAIPAVWWMVVLGLFEGTAFAMAMPAIYLLVSRSSPIGRSSTAQGIIGASGTLGTIVASVLAGVLAATDLRLPFWVTGIVTLVVPRDRAAPGPAAPLRRDAAPAARRGSGTGVRGRVLTDRRMSGTVTNLRGVEQRQLVGLITRRSEVRILPPQPTRFS